MRWGWASPACSGASGALCHLGTVPTLGSFRSARFLMGRRPPAPPLRQQSPQVPRASSAVLSAAKHLLYSFPHFLWSQGHHHLSYRGSLLRTKSGNIPMALPCLRNSCPASVCKNHAPGQPGSCPPPPGREQRLQFIVIAEAEAEAEAQEPALPVLTRLLPTLTSSSRQKAGGEASDHDTLTSCPKLSECLLMNMS